MNSMNWRRIDRLKETRVYWRITLQFRHIAIMWLNQLLRKRSLGIPILVFIIYWVVIFFMIFFFLKRFYWMNAFYYNISLWIFIKYHAPFVLYRELWPSSPIETLILWKVFSYSSRQSRISYSFPLSKFIIHKKNFK